MFLIRMVPFKLVLWLERMLMDNYQRTLNFLTGNNDLIIKYLSEKKLEQAFKKALKSPAYADFLRKNNIKTKPLSADKIKRIIPETDKKNYVTKYSYEERCINGKFPAMGNIDESSGSTGHPTNWIRSYAEESLLIKACYFEYNYTFAQKKQAIVISAWSSGPWATGVKFCEVLEHFALVKNTGTDRNDIMETIRDFGDKYHYIISGYPLFLEGLFEMKFPWKRYSIDVITGGDGYSSVWPEKIRHRLRVGANIISSYGCSDIDIGIGFETPFSQEIRDEAARNKDLSKELFGNLNTTPMLFQYNPLMHHIHNINKNEFLITYLDPDVVCPKIKYNILDIGSSIDFKQMVQIIKKNAPHLWVRIGKKKLLHLPFLYIAGRKDGTLSFDGGNVFPDQIDIIMTRNFNKTVRRFKMLREENKRFPFQLLVELHENVRKSKSLKKKLENKIKKELPSLNKDYAESLDNNSRLAPVVTLYSLNEGPFKEDSKRIKYKFVGK